MIGTYPRIYTRILHNIISKLKKITFSHEFENKQDYKPWNEKSTQYTKMIECLLHQLGSVFE